MQKNNSFLSKKNQWLSFAVGIIAIVLLLPSFKDFWNAQEKLVQTTLIIISIPILLLLIFSGKIAQDNPSFYKRLTGFDPGKKLAPQVKRSFPPYLKILAVCLLVFIAGLILTLLNST